MDASLHKRDIGARLKLVREAHGLKQAEMARRLGIPRDKLNAWERGRYYPDPVTVLEVRRQFHVTADYLYFGDRGALAYDVAVRLEKAEEASSAELSD